MDLQIVYARPLRGLFCVQFGPLTGRSVSCFRICQGKRRPGLALQTGVNRPGQRLPELEDLFAPARRADT